MEYKKPWIKLTVSGIASALLLSNCVTSYDSYGRPIQTVDPAAVAVGAVALGAVAYAAGKDNRRHYRHPGYYRNSGYGYGRRGGHCRY
ncbi:MAG: hypothetical protein KJO79_00530 [Verrucomicrobiae bacterium]|nr:hypothetical protein [Verrucomicrobiae bacterium]NNJ85628.1 hypothetical protein [Akkermansiaceae bacterium]